MEIPHLVRERLGDEPVQGTVNLGDEDTVCVSPTRTFVYRGEGLLSDESVAVYSHDVEQFDISEGRRKVKFIFEYIDGTESFTVPRDRAETVRKLLLGGILHVAGVTDLEESVSDVFSFSELTLVVTSNRLVKHVGAKVWDDDYEEFPYADVTGLAFEEGNVATQVVLSVNGRPQRIKAPNDEARKVERALTQALCAYHDVESLAEFSETVGDVAGTPGTDDDSESFSLDDDISPLVGGSDAEAAGEASEAGSGGASRSSPTESRSGSRTESPSESRSSSPAESHSEPATESRSDDAGTDSPATDHSGTTPVDTVSASPAGERGDDRAAVDPEDIEAMKDQLSTLTTAVKRQNELLRDQQETIEKLIEELRRGR